MTTSSPISIPKSVRRQRHEDRAGHWLIPHIRALTESLKSATAEQLVSETLIVRRALASGQSPAEPHLLAAGLSLTVEALRRARGVVLYDVQLLGAMAMTRRSIAQMQTGEGKTFVAMTAALHLAMTGRGVHVMTPNSYLAERDAATANAVGQHLGLSVALLPERDKVALKPAAYDCDVIYGTGHEFGFDYLRDQLTLRSLAQHRLGTRALDVLANGARSGRATMQRSLAFAVVDEADSVLIDDAGSPLVLSMAAESEAPDAHAHLVSLQLAALLKSDDEFIVDAATGRVELTEAGVRRCHAADVAIPVNQLRRPWTEYVVQALRASHLFRRDVHYVVLEDEVRIVDESTGRIFEDRSWQDGLHQAVEAREGLTITAEKDAAAQVTRQRFFRLYENLSGMTGTATGCEPELSAVYQLNVEEIPLRVPSRRIMLPIRCFVLREQRNSAITSAAARVQSEGRAVLIGTRSIGESDELAERLAATGLACTVLNGLQNASEADIVSAAGQPGSITIATNLAGRGTDIHLHTDVRERGGLHVIVAGCQISSRMDRQLIGRCARQGDPGSAQIFVSSDDALLTMHGPWLSSALQREANSDGEVKGDFTAAIHRVQSAAERKHFASRMSLLQQDIQRDSMLKRLK